MITCNFENGNKASLRHVTVKALMLNEGREVLLIKRAKHLTRAGKYDIPGGFLDRDETTEECALRELREETSLEGKIKFLFRINDNPKRPKEDRQNVDFIYVVEFVSGKVNLDEEGTEYGWFQKDNLPPDEEFAFDHRDSILRYFEYLEKPFSLPIIG